MKALKLKLKTLMIVVSISYAVVWIFWLNSVTVQRFTHSLHDIFTKKIHSKQSVSREADFQQLIKSRADEKRRIFLSVFDSAYVELTFNLYLTSFVRLKIRNYVLVGSDKKACKALQRLKVSLGLLNEDLACITYFDDVAGSEASEHRSLDFNRKSHYKTKIILDALRCGVTVVIVDIDIVFFKNPLPYMNCSKCDIEIQPDVSQNNSGFYLARPTTASIELHRRALQLTTDDEGRTVWHISNQLSLARISKDMQRTNEILIQTLPKDLFPTGLDYYEKRHIMFAGDDNARNDSCVMVHNCWILTNAAKIYRFKETGMWQVDADRYYSDVSRKYLAYENPVDFGDSKTTLAKETDALKAALLIGYLLNRTVILPAFHCRCLENGRRDCNGTSKLCPLNRYFLIQSFDAQLSGRYREHVFLRHPLVPGKIRSQQSESMLIETNDTRQHRLQQQVARERRYKPGKDGFGHVTKKEIVKWFGGMTSRYSVLRFHSLYGIFVGALKTVNSADLSFVENKLLKSLVPSDYRQLSVKSTKKKKQGHVKDIARKV